MMETSNLHKRPIGELVRDDYRTAEVLSRWKLDYCCGGKRNLEEACNREGADIREVTSALEQILAQPAGRAMDYNAWSTTFLIDHIEQVHHSYVRKSLPILVATAQKVALRHGQEYPYLETVFLEVKALALELESHLGKEENILFPYIRKLLLARSRSSQMEAAPFGTINNPIHMMESEHEDAGESLQNIRQLTNDLVPPEAACTSWRVLYKLLEEFEADLHTHIHLENNILFARAIQLEKETTFGA